MHIIVRSGTKSQQKQRRFNRLARYVNGELNGPSPIKGKVYDFKDWSGSKVHCNTLGSDRNGMKMKEMEERKSEYRRKG